MKDFKLINRITGWLAFLIAAIVYLLTIEPTTSFWDCGEFITTAYKLEVGHPPGAPLFMIASRVFSLFAFGEVTLVAKMVNAMSALASAFTIMFLFWTITHLARKMVFKNTPEPTTPQIAAVIGAGLVGALAYTFSDTFWFSAVEAEVYASSSLFTAVVFWAILKWENIANEKYANRWLILIAYLMGLSIGVHLLNLLAIPAIVFVYYFKKYKVSRRGVIYAFLISVGLLAVVMYGIIHGVVVVASKFELLFVNGLNLPYNSGVLFYIVLLLGAVVYGIYYSYQRKKVWLNTALTMFAVILIGYSSFAMIVIRSMANPPMDENNPENVFALASYLNREQYGDRPLLYGQYYNAPITEENEGKSTYIKRNGRYEPVIYIPDYEYDSRFMTLFPRMYSDQDQHVRAYNNWTSVNGPTYTITNPYSGEAESRQRPSFFNNIGFFLKYQLGHMYFRYFMWNFSGRQNDEQGHGNFLKGNFMTGIPFLDEVRIGEQDNLPGKLAFNPARNVYYMLPFVLGLIGFFFHAQRHSHDFWVVMLLFFFTGIAIVIYLNQTPYQPRERDYAYAGSFYAYAIWIGLGVLALFEGLKKKLSPTASAAVAVAVTLLIPIQMAGENWDDHDRSGRYTARDFAYNYLNSCAPNAIIFTYGDNDTFPLWYAQEVEGIRTDVRVVNLSLLGTDWYIDQMKRKAYESDPVPFSLTHKQYVQGTRDVNYVLDRMEEPVLLSRAIEFLGSDDPQTKSIPGYPGEYVPHLPSRNLRIPVDSATVVENGTVSPEDAHRILPEVQWTLSRNYLMKSDMMILDLLANFNWERPVYFAISGNTENFLDLQDYLRLEGFAYRLVPYKVQPEAEGAIGEVAPDIMYENMMEKFQWGRMNADDVFIDQQNIRTSVIMGIRETFARLANSLTAKGEKEKAIAVLNKCTELMPDEKFPYDQFMINVVEEYFAAGATEKGYETGHDLLKVMSNELDYYLSLDTRLIQSIDYEIQVNIMIIHELARIGETYGHTKLQEEADNNFNAFYLKFMQLSGDGLQF